MKKRYVGLVFLAIVLCLGVGVGIFSVLQKKPAEETEKKYNITILDSGEYYYSDEGIANGINMALKKIEEEYSLDIVIDIVDDNGDYAKGISMAKERAQDPDVDIVISIQNFESIGPEVGFFEDAEKPFIVTSGCYDSVAANSYQYFLADFLSAQDIGARIGKYALENNSKNVVMCHSDTVFEKDEIRGFQSVLLDEKDISIRDITEGPYDEEDLASLLLRIDELNVDTAVANFYDQEDSAWLLSRLRSERPEITVIGDYALDNSDILKQYGEELEGVIIVPVYPYQNSQKLEEYQIRYEQETGAIFTSAAVQYYDLFCYLAMCLEKTGGTGEEFMNMLKSEEGYDGVSGAIRFDENGQLQAEDCPLFVCRDGRFVFLEEESEE